MLEEGREEVFKEDVLVLLSVITAVQKLTISPIAEP